MLSFYHPEQNSRIQTSCRHVVSLKLFCLVHIFSIPTFLGCGLVLLSQNFIRILNVTSNVTRLLTTKIDSILWHEIHNTPMIRQFRRREPSQATFVMKSAAFMENRDQNFEQQFLITQAMPILLHN